MYIFRNEIKVNRTPLLIWSLSIGLLIASVIFMYPSMKDQMDDVNRMFSSMGGFSAAFGMDQLNFGELMGFYAVEGGSILGIGGAFFAAITAVTSLMKEERDRTAEFLMTHPVSRTRVITEKLLSVIALITILNLISFALTAVSVKLIGEELDIKMLILMSVAYYVMQLEVAGICFGISAFISKSGLGIGIGLAAGMYMLNIISNITDDAKALKYITAFGYTDGADIIKNESLQTGYLITGLILMAAGIAAAYIRYSRKDLRS